MLQWESASELNAFRLLDCDPEVRHFREQPCEITFSLGGSVRKQFPDILVERGKDKELWEIRSEYPVRDADFAARTELLLSALPEWGYSYRVVIGEELASRPRLANTNLLLTFGRRPVTETEFETVRRAIKQTGCVTWFDACTGRFGPASRAILCRLVLQGQLVIDMQIKLSRATRFYPAGEL